MKRTPNKTVLCIIWVCTINWKHNKKGIYRIPLFWYYIIIPTIHTVCIMKYIGPWIFFCEFNEKKFGFWILNELVSYTSMLIIEYILLLCIWIVCIRWGNIMLNNLYIYSDVNVKYSFILRSVLLCSLLKSIDSIKLKK